MAPGIRHCCTLLTNCNLLPTLQRACAESDSFARVFQSGYFFLIPKRGRKEQEIPMTQNSRRQKVMIAVVLSLFVLVMQAGFVVHKPATAPHVHRGARVSAMTQPPRTLPELP